MRLRYGCQIWEQNQSKIVEEIGRAQNKALHMLNSNGPQELVDYLYKDSKIDQLNGIIRKANCWFVSDQLKNNLLEASLMKKCTDV